MLQVVVRLREFGQSKLSILARHCEPHLAATRLPFAWVSIVLRRSLVTLGLVVIAVVVLGASGVLTPVFSRPLPISVNGGVATIDIQPVPEGPQLRFERIPRNGSKPVSQIDQFVPDPLPPAMNNWGCSQGGNLIVTLGNGMQRVYGPCYLPASIDHLWAEIMYTESNAQCAPRCGPGGRSGP